MKSAIRNPQSAISAQEELAFSAIKAHALFPGRTSLRVAEVAHALSLCDQQVIDLIDAGELHALNIASEVVQKSMAAKGQKVPRNYWRIPVSAFDEFIQRRKNA